MDRYSFNRTLAIVPIVMSLMALVLVAVTTGWQTHLPDEGIAARLFQLLIFTQPVVVVIFLATANWARPLRVAGFILLHVLAAAAALGTLFWFESRGL